MGIQKGNQPAITMFQDGISGSPRCEPSVRRVAVIADVEAADESAQHLNKFDGPTPDGLNKPIMRTGVNLVMAVDCKSNDMLFEPFWRS